MMMGCAYRLASDVLGSRINECRLCATLERHLRDMLATVQVDRSSCSSCAANSDK